MLDFTEHDSGQLVAYSDQTKDSYWINEGNSKTPHTLDVINYCGAEVAHVISVSSSLDQLKRTADIFDMISLGVIDAELKPSTKLWEVSFGGFVSHGTSLPYAVQNWQYMDSNGVAA